MSSLTIRRLLVATAVGASLCSQVVRADVHLQPLEDFAAEGMRCKLYLVKADDGSAVGFFVHLRNLSLDDSYFVEGTGATLSLRVRWKAPLPHGKEWSDMANPVGTGVHDPKFLVEFTRTGSFWYFLSFAELMTKPLPADTLTDCTVAVWPCFKVGAIKPRGSDQWVSRSVEFKTGRVRSFGFAENVTLKRATIEVAAARYAPKVPPAVNDQLLPPRSEQKPPFKRPPTRIN